MQRPNIIDRILRALWCWLGVGEAMTEPSLEDQ